MALFMTISHCSIVLVARFLQIGESRFAKIDSDSIKSLAMTKEVCQFSLTRDSEPNRV